MPALPSFTAFFHALWGYDPFPWQTMLADKIAIGHWPQALDLPTAAGKTACIDAAIYALAYQADKPTADRTAPRRIWFVVDRRIVVDEAFDRASIIARKLARARLGPLRQIADRLRRVSGTKRALAVARLRGGILRDDSQARLPTQPAVITSTVDQLGSRLLFRGYGRSNLTASIFAGLAAHDSLILLDEAHLSVPFMQTLRAIDTFRSNVWVESPITTPFAFAILSATPPSEISTEAVFPGNDRARALDHPTLHKRMAASKPAQFLEVSPTKDNDVLMARAAEQAWEYVEKHKKQRVAVIVNRVHTAAKIADNLRQLISSGAREEVDSSEPHTTSESKADVVLLTGRLRPYERDRLLDKWKPVLKAVSPEARDTPVILVSTQCIEVGADFSFDALVTEAASLDALRQRFGRLNRMGDPGPAPATVLIRERDLKDEQNDPIYDASIRNCWRLLTNLSNAADGDRSIDFGINALDDLLSNANAEELSSCFAPRSNAPVLLPAHLDLLCQTSPTPSVAPDIRLFLHGKDRGISEARIVWRADLTADNHQSWKETVALCPPVSGEMLTVPLHRLRSWLRDDKDASDEGTSDIEGAVERTDGMGEEEDGKRSQTIRRVLVWRGRDRSQTTTRASSIKPDDVIVVPAGYDPGDIATFDPTETVGENKLDLWETAQEARGRTVAVRLQRMVFERWLKCAFVKDLIDLAHDDGRDFERLLEAIDALPDYDKAVDDESAQLPEWLLTLLRRVRQSRPSWEDHPAGGVILFARKSASVRKSESDLFVDDDDLSSASGEKVTLESHTLLVKRAVGKIASRCLPQKFLDPLVSAAHWHDVGKLDERFQTLLRNGDIEDSQPLAKSAFMPTSPARRKDIREACGLPEGFRHEMLSLQLAERHSNPPDDSEGVDLILHLIASHHGHARPFAPVAPDPEPPTISGQINGAVIEINSADRAQLTEPYRVDSGISTRFWRLTRRYGWWGLAYLEALLRLGDWYGSEHVISTEESETPAPAQPRPIKTSAVIAANDELVLTGLDGGNPLGFLAALGTLSVLRNGTFPLVRLGWKRSAAWQPVLTGISAADRDAACDAIVTALRGSAVSAEAEDRRKTAQASFDSARKAVKAKREEIKKRQLRGKERKSALEKELAPLEESALQMRSAWLSALKNAVPSPELALGKHIDCDSDEYRDYAVSFTADSGVARRASLDLLAAFASDACLQKSGRVAATPFCFVTGSGHQYFLDTVRQLMKEADAARVQFALFEPWSYTDEKLSLRWDPMEDRRYALMDRDPTASDNRSRTVWMANLLAYRALTLFPSAPGRRGLETTGWSSPGELEFFTWPIWDHPVDADTVRSQMLLPDLSTEILNRKSLRARGVVAIFRSQRIRVGTEPNVKINFEPARGI